MHIMAFPSQKKKKKPKTAQNKCKRLCLDLPSSSHTALTHFRKINWVPVSEKVESCIATTVFKNWNGTVPLYIKLVT